ncbi:MAG: hypothetical protein ACE5FN_01870 [Leptospirillia bacterium]
MATRQYSGGDVDHDLIAQVDAQGDAHGDRYSDADLYRQIEKSQRNIPWWLVVMVGVVMLMAVALNAPFLGDRGSTPAELLTGAASGGFLDIGMLLALFYVGGGFIVIFWFTFSRKGS